ncbi:MAG: hypothetical protein RIS47_1102, partial [Bacteroidota bacterium]
MISLDNVSVYFGGTPLFNKVSFLVDKKDKIGLVGKNGAGKSTMLKIIIGTQAPSEGTLSLKSEISLGYLPQTMQVFDTVSVREEARKAFEHVLQLKRLTEEINVQLSTREDYESAEYLKLIDKLTVANDHFQNLGGNTIEADIEKVLLGLGFSRELIDAPTSTFSGGWRMRIELAKILLRRPDALLLDEPTNHLDIESIQWLEQELINFQGGMVLISHDKRFLDRVTNRTVEISLGRIYDYRASYSEYKVLRAERVEQQMSAFKNQQKQIEDTEKFIERFRYKATKSVQVQSRIKQLDKIDRIEIEEEDKSAVHFKFAPAPRSGNVVVKTVGVSKSFGAKHVLSGIDFELERTDKVAFVGKNGEGKTTFSKIIIGEHTYEGELKLGHNVTIGYYAQDQDRLLDGERTVLETLDDIATGDIRRQVRDILGAFLFRGEDVEKKVKVLSGGERSRLALAKLLLQPYNLLVLDEPTNHLDIPSKEVLKQALLNYDGAMVVVSHDRDFLDGLTDSIYEFSEKSIKLYYGGLSGFLEKKALANMNEFEKKRADDKVLREAKQLTDNKVKFEQRKEVDKRIRKVEQDISRVEAEIGKIEAQIDDANVKMAE